MKLLIAMILVKLKLPIDLNETFTEYDAAREVV